jgi:CBS domain-containing protein
MKIADISRRAPVTIPATASVREAARAMQAEHVGVLGLTDPFEPGRIVGVVTDRDLVLHVLAAERPVDGQVVAGACSSNLHGVPKQASVHDAVDAMKRHGVRRLLVLGDDGRSVEGVLSMDDVLGVLADELAALAATLRAGLAREGEPLRAAREAR